MNLFRVLYNCHNHSLQPVLFAGKDIPSAEINAFKPFLVQSPIINPCFNRSRKTASNLNAILLGKDHRKERVFKDHYIDVIFENATYYGWRFEIPVLAWIPDFQHRLLPHLFSRKAWWRREIGFQMQVLSKRTTMLSSVTAQQDYARFYPRNHTRTVVVPFAVLLPKAMLPDTAPKLQQFPDRIRGSSFFLLPNQFWKHKNHEVVIRALKILKDRGCPVQFIVTGATEDQRNRDHFTFLTKLINQAGVAEYFYITGIIPYADLLALMQSCLAMVNPSFCEGWSTSVEEAKSLGIALILSDIPVHREQANKKGVFFDPTSPSALADCLEIFKHKHKILQKKTDRGLAAAEKFAVEFESAVLKALNTKLNPGANTDGR